MFSRDDSDRCSRGIDAITAVICLATLYIGCIVGLAIYPVLILIFGGAAILLSFAWQAYRRIRAALSRSIPDEHAESFEDRVG